MKRFGTKGVILVAAFGLLTACSASANMCPRPVWANAPPALGAVGIAKGINTGTARDSALDKGRHELARQISAKIMGMLERSLQEVIGAGDGEVAGHEYKEEVTRTLHKQFLSGSRAVEYWRDCDTGEWYALVTIEKEGLLAAANQAAKQAAEKMMAAAEEKHEELIKKLDEQLDKEYGAGK